MLSRFNSILEKLGYHVINAPKKNDASTNQIVLKDEEVARAKLIKYYSVNTIIDVGANVGQFASAMRHSDYLGSILSFEPQESAFSQLQLASQDDKRWHVFHHALGTHKQQLELNIAGNSYSSSILDMLPAHEAYAPESKYVSKETISVDSLDNIFENLVDVGDNIFLKIDTQGYEKQVLEGAARSLHSILLIQLEMSLQPLYDNEPLFDEIYTYLTGKNFELLTVENGIRDKVTGCLLQIDGIFINKTLAGK